VVDYLKLADHSWPLLRRVMGAHALLYRATGGRLGERLPGVPAMLLLDHVGARSARRRTTPLVYMPDGDDLVIVAAKGGHPRDPAWLHNLRANPDTEIQLGSRRVAVRATEAGPEERRRLWPKAVGSNALWGHYQARTRREIPLVILRPRAP
jgi:deazaflavin-dependent oxidoreductase (nitroreductase family)